MKWALLPIELRDELLSGLILPEVETGEWFLMTEHRLMIREAEQVVVGDVCVFGACIAGRAATHFAYPIDRLPSLKRIAPRFAGQIDAADIVVTPFVHIFIDARGDEFAVVAWGKADATRRMEEHGPPRVTLPVEWTCAWDCWPSNRVTWLRNNPEGVRDA